MAKAKLAETVIPVQVPEQGLLTLSYHGKVPEILRAMADQLDVGACKVERLHWDLTEERLEFSASLNMKP